MTSLIYLVALALLGQARSEVIELNCSDNATCIDNMARAFVRSIRQQKPVKMFDLFTIEPVESRQARSSQDPLTRFITTHAVSIDWNDFTFRFSNPEGRNDAMDLEVFESRSAKDKHPDTEKHSCSSHKQFPVVGIEPTTLDSESRSLPTAPLGRL
ncbi:jg18224 [Pararge aegeria aegeria]|uniref:Jg18224 protein n=1 Tax=Pararge aegeria aegeria TaxID=348720 RepID=A0A8S4RCY3_9NEOP|nr:jg18224 [Pararge aegeria aegeria]